MKTEIIISLISIGIALATFLALYFGFIGRILEKIGDLQLVVGKVANLDFAGLLTRVVGLCERVAKIEERMGSVNFMEMSKDLVTAKVKTDLFWGAVESMVRDIIKQPIHFRKDELIDKFPDLSEEEICELKNILEGEIKELRLHKDIKVLAYGLMMARINIVLHERQQICVDILGR